MAENGIETAKEGTSIPEPENGYQNEREVMKNELKDSVVIESTRKQTPPKAAKDELDSASVYSLFMEKDARYYFQHPYCRILVAYVVTFCNFLIYAEDPMAHSMKESSVPVIGNDFSFIFTKYSPNAWSLLKVILWIAAIFTGLVLGKLLFHQMLFKNCFKLKMFQNDQGSWMTMFFTAILCLFIFSYLYNLFLIIGGEATDVYKVSSAMGISNSYFMKGAACGTWCGDFFTAWMVTDIVLQEKLYPDWAKGLRIWWKRKYNRIILFWIVLSITSFVVLFVIATDYINWDKLNHGFLPSNEFSRAFGASIILVLDLIIVMQDWDFPHFVTNLDVKLPGLNSSHILFTIPKCLREDQWVVHITGKWFNYGILFIVVILDINMWKNQIFYVPFESGQYVGPHGRIYTVTDKEQLQNDKAFLSFEWRNSTINPETNSTYLSADSVMNSCYLGYSLGIKSIAFIPSICVFLIFGFLLWQFGRLNPDLHNPYSGRLKKRKKYRFSFFRRSKRTSPKCNPVLVKFKNSELKV